MTNLVQNTKKTMTHFELSEFTGSRTDKVKQTIERLSNQKVIELPPMGEVAQQEGGRVVNRMAYHVNERDSYIVVAQIDAKFTADLVDRWRALENGEVLGANALPESFICGDAALILEYGLSAIAGLPDFNSKTKTYQLEKDFVLKKFTIGADKGGSTYKKMPAWIFDMAEAGITRMIFVTNHDNPHIDEIKAYVEKMIKVAGSHCRICLMSDKFASKSVEPTKPRSLPIYNGNKLEVK